MAKPAHPDGLWIFGYGSLIFRPSFPFIERRSAILSGFSRRFWQGSTDHRGVPGAPGRVVTLISEPNARCWGVAYRISADDVQTVLRHLDHREQGGYRRHDVLLELTQPTSDAELPIVDLEPRESTEKRNAVVGSTEGGTIPESTRRGTTEAQLVHPYVPATIYVAEAGNVDFLGPATIDEIAEVIYRSRGPSGENREYVVRLAESLRRAGQYDEHVFAIEARLAMMDVPD